MTRLFAAISIVLLVSIVACQREEKQPTSEQKTSAQPLAASSPKHAQKNNVLVIQPQVVDKLDCKAISDSMVLAKLQHFESKTNPPAELEAADLACRLMEKESQTSDESGFVVMASIGDEKAFGFVRQKDIERAGNACATIVSAVPALLESVSVSEAAVLGAAGEAGCRKLQQEAAAGNPLVVVAGTTVLASGYVDIAGQLIGEIPGMDGIAKSLADANRKFEEGFEKTLRAPVEWTREHPKEALVAANSQLALADPRLIKQAAEEAVRLIKGTGASADAMRMAANPLGGQIKFAVEKLVPRVSKGDAECTLNPALCANKKVLEKLGIDL